MSEHHITSKLCDVLGPNKKAVFELLKSGGFPGLAVVSECPAVATVHVSLHLQCLHAGLSSFLSVLFVFVFH